MRLAARKWALQSWRGGLGSATVVANAVFAAITGSSIASAAAVMDVTIVKVPADADETGGKIGGQKQPVKRYATLVRDASTGEWKKVAGGPKMRYARLTVLFRSSAIGNDSLASLAYSMTAARVSSTAMPST